MWEHIKTTNPDFFKLLFVHAPVFADMLRHLRALILGGPARLVLPQSLLKEKNSKLVPSGPPLFRIVSMVSVFIVIIALRVVQQCWVCM